MKSRSLGLVETLGITAAIEAADTALKAANVECLGYEINKAGYVTIKLAGDVSAVQAAVQSGAAAAARVGQLVASHVISRADNELLTMTLAQTEDNRKKSAKNPESARDTSEAVEKEVKKAAPARRKSTKSTQTQAKQAKDEPSGE